MKQETGKKGKKLWLWLIIALAALVAVAGVVLGVFWSDIFGAEDPNAGAAATELYWNIDRESFVDEETGLSNRLAGEDGLFTIRYAYNGQQVELKAVNDKRLINYIDTMDVMGLVFDAEGLIVDAVDAKTIATEVVKDNYVSEVADDYIRVNSSMTMGGMSTKIKFTDATKVYNVAPDAENIGAEGVCAQLDRVTVYADAEENVTHVYITKRVKTGEIYYVFGNQYDSNTKETTRVPDENGVYTITLAHEGEHVDVKVKDKDLMSNIDSASGPIGLRFDEEGYAIEKLDAASAMLGIKEFANYTVTELDGKTFTAERFMVGAEQGNTYTGTLRDDADVFIVETYCTAEFIGQRTELQIGDRFDLYTDLEGNPMLLYIVGRKVDSPMYWNITQSKNWSTGETSRKPDDNGYYHIPMVCDGKEVELRCKDKDLVSEIDNKWERACGLELKGDVIIDVYDARCVCGLYGAGTFRYITTMSGNVVQMAAQTNWENVSNYIVPSTCKVYDVSGYYGTKGTKMGSETKIKKYDCVTAFQNESGELTHVFITERYEEGTKVYYDTAPSWTTKVDGVEQTARKANEEGYYVFKMVCEGKSVEVKTKSLSMATYIEKQWPDMAALKVNGSGVITAAYPARAAFIGGHDRMRGNYVTGITSDGVLKNGPRKGVNQYGESADLQLAEKYVVYNCSAGFVNYRGEKTTLKKGDQFTAIGAYPSGEIVALYIMDRRINSPVYWNTNRYSVKTVDGVQETTRPTDADGYYVFELIDCGKITTIKTKDKEVATKIDATGVGFVLATKNGVATKFYAPTLAYPDTTRYGVGGFDVMEIDGDTITATRNRPQASDYGTTETFKLAKNCKIINVCTYSANYTKLDKVELGDRITTYRNPEGEATYVFIVNDSNRINGHVGYCEHCSEEVFWEPYLGEFCTNKSFHYYLPHDVDSSYGPGVGGKDMDPVEIILDLNGKTFLGAKNAFSIRAKNTLTILDSVGGGKVQSRMDYGDKAGDPGVIHVFGTLNLLSGTICPAEDAKVPANGGTIYANGTDAVINIHGGLVTGGRTYKESGATFGGNLHLSSGATLNMYGGTISNGVAGGPSGYGGNVNLSTGSKANIYGGTITGGQAKFGGNINFTVSNKEGVPNEATLNMSGGTISNGTAGMQGGNILISNEGKGLTFNMTGGKITGGNASSGGNIYARISDVNIGGTVENGTATTAAANVWFYTTNVNTLNVTGTIGAPAADSENRTSLEIRSSKQDGAIVNLNSGKIKGDVLIPVAAKVTVSGTPELDKLVLAATAKLHLGELSNGADIVVSASNVFTVANEKAYLYKQYFRPANEGDLIELNEDNTLSYIENDQFDNSDLAFKAGTNLAVCPACNKEVAWTALVSETETVLVDGGHYYLAEDVTFKQNGKIYLTMASTGDACVHLNGHNATLDGGAAFLSFDKEATSSVSVMGNGNVTGKSSDAILKCQNAGTMTLYGGTYTNIGTGTVATMFTSTLTVTGDTVIGSDAYPAGITASGANSALYVKGGNIKTITLNDAKTVTLSGKPVIGMLNVKEGKKIDLGELRPGADITVFAEGVFTSASAKAVNFLDYFKAAVGTYEIVVKDDALCCQEIGLPETVVTGLTDNLQFLEGTNYAYCPVCAKTAEWIALDLSAANNLNGGCHYYLTGAAALEGQTYMTMAASGKACVHLNGNNITMTVGASALAFAGGSSSTVNFMGSGTVATTSNGGQLLDMGNGGSAVLHSGIYGNNGTGPVANMWTSTLTVKKDAQILNGGVKVNGAGSVLVVDGAQISKVNYIKGSVTVSGAPVIADLTIASGNAITLGELTIGADITVNATGAFTKENANAATYATYFKAVAGYQVTEQDGILYCEEAQLPPAVQTGITDDLQFVAGSNKAWCAVCQAEVTWQGLNNNSSVFLKNNNINAEGDHHHYYLTEDLVGKSGQTNGLIQTTDESGVSVGTACVHLNGHNITNEYGRAIYVSGASDTLNILGTGNITAGAASTYGAVMYVKGNLNLYSGTYAKTAAAAEKVLLIQNTNTTVTYYQDVVINDANSTTTLRGEGGHMVFKGGQINGVVSATAAQSVSLSGEPVITKLNLKAGLLMQLGQLGANTNIGITGSGAIAEANDNAATYVNYFTCLTAGKRVVNNAGVLTIEDIPEVVLPTITDNLTFETGTTNAYCPVCEETVEWTALALDAANALEGGKHYYLNGTAAVNGGAYMTMAATGKACVHLNGNNMELDGGTTALTFASGASSTVNIMGTGEVVTNANSGYLLYMANGGSAVLHSGTYYNKGTGTLATMYTSNLTVEKDAVLGTDAYLNTVNVNSGGAKLTINGATVKSVTLNNGTVTLNGAPVISNLTVASGKLVTLGELTTGADITVSAEGAFTVENTNAASYVSYFKAADAENKEIKAENNVLSVVNKTVTPPPTAEQTAATDKLKFVEGTKIAWCAACQAEKTWIAVDNTYSVYMTNWGGSDHHYYLTTDFVKNNNDYIMQTNGIGSACLHLNGFNLTNGALGTIYVSNANDTLNVLGTGTVSGNGSYAAVMYVKGTLNLLSGGYVKAANNTMPLMVVNTTKTITFGKDVIIQDPDSVTTIRSDAGATYNVNGAIINGAFSTTGANCTVNVSGAAVIKKLNLRSGNKINVGTLEQGASIGVNDAVVATDLTFSNAPAAYAPYFHATKAGDAVVPTADDKLNYSAGAIKWTDETNSMAICPVCNVEAKWQKLDNTSLKSVFLYNNAQTATHFYASENLERNNGEGAIQTSTSTDAGLSQYCLHLNGKNITNTAANGRAIFVGAGASATTTDTLNIMGSGTVTATAGGQGSIYVRNSNNTLNLYGGTYTIDSTEVKNLIDNRGTLTIGDGVVLENPNGIAIINKQTGVVAINGGTINGEVVIDAAVTDGYSLTLAGVPAISKLTVPAGKVITLGNLTTGATITVAAEGVFTVANADAATLKEYFVVAVTGDTIAVESDNTLSYTAAATA